MLPTTDLSQAVKNLENQALNEENFSDFFVDTTESRGGLPIFETLLKALSDSKLESNHYLLTGARGCGKSTELIRLQKKLDGEFLTVRFSVQEELDLFEFSHVELIIATMKKLFEAASNANIDVAEDYLKPIKNWVNTVDEKLVTTENEQFNATVGVEAKLGFLATIFSKLSASAKYDRTFIKSEHLKDDKVMSQLIDSSNVLITEIKNRLEADNKGLLVIVEDLDKVDIKLGEKLFFDSVSRLKALNVNTIFTFPISLRFNTRANVVINSVKQLLEIPMLKTHTKDGNPYMENGQSIIKKLLLKRMDSSLFESEEVMMSFIRYSGGVLWDLFRFIRNAASFTLTYDRNVITMDDFEKGRMLAINDYRATLADRMDGNNVIVPVKEYYDTLVRVVTSPNKEPENTNVELELRQNLCVLGYNLEGWIDVHPIVKEILIRRGQIDEGYRIK